MTQIVQPRIRGLPQKYFHHSSVTVSSAIYAKSRINIQGFVERTPLPCQYSISLEHALYAFGLRSTARYLQDFGIVVHSRGFVLLPAKSCIDMQLTLDARADGTLLLSNRA